MPSRPAVRERFSFANLDEVLPLPDLISIQRDSFRWFLEEGLADTFRDISPIEDFTGSLQARSSSSTRPTRTCARRRSSRWRSAKRRT